MSITVHETEQDFLSGGEQEIKAHRTNVPKITAKYSPPKAVFDMPHAV